MDILHQNLMILASAGSGKTYQLGNRIVGLVARGANPGQIVALTFTRKAAGEFAEAVLSKLAKAATEPAVARRLRDELGLPDADFTATLERVVQALPRLTLGTIDSFFAKVVRLFQYEFGITGGTFELVEGPRAEALADEILADVLGDALSDERGAEFLQAFRRSTAGREDQGVVTPMRDSIRRWQERLQEDRGLAWGPASLAHAKPEDWETRKSQLAREVFGHMAEIDFTHRAQAGKLEEAVGFLEQHTIGSGSLGSNKTPTLLRNLLEAVAAGDLGSIRVKFQKEFHIGGRCADSLRDMIHLAADCEMAAALRRTRAVREVVGAFDSLCASRLRQQGRLGFHDIKILMGQWARDEESRLTREAIDFRLDARIRHWLLDEFQDTSRADWNGLKPLVDEVVSSDDGTLFVVGDRKQAIYAWRGGEVGLFDELERGYGQRLRSEPMAESWRSCPEVLELVNRVCGDTATMRQLFGPVADTWRWDHHVTAPELDRPDRRGEARVEVLEDADLRLERLTELLKELGVGTRTLTCGVLLRSNEQVREVAEHLRADFDVIEEGRRLPAKDNPLGIATTRLLRWLANPADRFSRETLAMSPLAARLVAAHGTWDIAWDTLTRRVAESGLAATVGSLLGDLWPELSEFGRRRAGDLLDALTEMDRQGVTSLREAAMWLDRLEVAQSPGSAAVQVMTIHKSKGLGFDVVVLPEIPDEIVPQPQRFDVAEGDGWISETPPKWARQLVGPMRDAEERWGQAQRYEALCTLYVALTRAKRGLYVFLDLPAESADPDKPSLMNWLRHATAAGSKPGIVWQCGDPDWTRTVATPDPKSGTDSTAAPHPGPAVPRRKRRTPSEAKGGQAIEHSASGMIFGNAVHALFETVGWIDESTPSLPDSQAAEALRRVLAEPSLADLFARGGRAVTLLREQPIDALVDGRLTSGVIDRLHLHRGPDGHPTRLHVIDYKTDAVADPEELLERYRGQMLAYREALRRVHPQAAIDCTLVSVRHARRIDVGAE